MEGAGRRGGGEADDGNEELSGKGFERMCGLTRDQQLTFITIRALAASPLFMGGDLPTSDAFSMELITNPKMIECNQNGVMGSLAYRRDGIDVWCSPRKGGPSAGGWVGIFNRTPARRDVAIPLERLGLPGIGADGRGLISIWHEPGFIVGDRTLHGSIAADGVLFLEFRHRTS